MESKHSASKVPDIKTESADSSTQPMADLVKVEQELAVKLEPGIKMEPHFVDFTHPIMSLNEMFQPKIEKIEALDKNHDDEVENPSGLFDPVDQIVDLNPVNSNAGPEVAPISTIEPNLNHTDNVSHIENPPIEANATTTNQFETGCSYNHCERMIQASEPNEMATEANVEMPSTSTNSNANENRPNSTSKAKQHKCLVCGYVASSPSNLQAHMRTHSGEKPFACDSCLQQFTQKAHLQRHMKLHVTQDSLKCSVCWQIFATRSELLVHKLRCKRRYECHLCKAYSTFHISNLKRHMQVHSGLRPFQCGQCLMKFTILGNLKAHMKKIHTNPRACPLKYRCSVCARNFVEQPVKDEHQMKCKRRRFECYVCQSYATNLKAHLQSHMRMKHTGERPFKCTSCGKCYPINSDLSRHKKRSHKQQSL